MIARRALLTGAAVAASFGLGVRAAAQPPKKAARIGVLYPGLDNNIFRGNFSGFREALAAGGYVEGRNLALEMRFGDARALPPLATELAKLPLDVILAIARSAVIAVHDVRPSTPVVAIDLESDPVASGFVKTLPQPGHNLTGVFMDFPELAGKWLEILKAVVPALARVAVLWDPATGAAQLDAAHRAAQVLKLQLSSVQARTTAEIGPAVDLAMRERPSGMIVLTSPILNSGRRIIIDLAARYRLPTLVPFPGYAHDGGLVAYGADVRTMYAQVGALALRILAGQRPAAIPVERPTRFTLSLNLKTAKVLGLTIPPQLLARADDVID